LVRAQFLDQHTCDTDGDEVGGEDPAGVGVPAYERSARAMRTAPITS
jgi:hypothetical protein